MNVDLGAKAELFDVDAPLLLPGVPLPLALLVLELAEVHDAADGRIRVRGNFHQVQVEPGRRFEGFVGSEHPQLVAFRIDDPHAPGPDLVVTRGPRCGTAAMGLLRIKTTSAKDAGPVLTARDLYYIIDATYTIAEHRRCAGEYPGGRPEESRRAVRAGGAATGKWARKPGVRTAGESWPSRPFPDASRYRGASRWAGRGRATARLPTRVAPRGSSSLDRDGEPF